MEYKMDVPEVAAINAPHDMRVWLETCERSLSYLSNEDFSNHVACWRHILVGYIVPLKSPILRCP